jgi:hypothetical protein
MLTLSESSSERVEALVLFVLSSPPQRTPAINPERGMNPLCDVDPHGHCIPSLEGSMPAIRRVNLELRIGLSRATNLSLRGTHRRWRSSVPASNTGVKVSKLCSVRRLLLLLSRFSPKHTEATSRDGEGRLRLQSRLADPRFRTRHEFQRAPSSGMSFRAPIRLVMPDYAVDAINSGSPSLNRKG